MKISYLKSSPSMIEVLKNNYEAFIIQNYKFNHLGLFHDEDSIYAVGNDSNLLIVFYVQIMPDDFVMQLHRF
ncbi:hypothetical protein ZS72_24085 [Salmonella enterica subsp. enterica serovar Typhimurium]|nr:hypothetical protein [Salmonella enterica subsp. enterica serovar Typhimurium]ECO0368319.1 hypothetical protein [Salmonella enterica subsp. enterica serovar Typhimurium]ECV8037362.1 hypothetical protein [Salmonella enterica subsp. enterica serovar Typhimurium]ECV8037490.1 hypothetical protein [Salmonella enterica subsp. enterica serovar Typhimurium]EEN8126142.1 hypothetical protein [Salmonella enterica subsp. enterica serovar Typhimurium]